MQIETGIQHEFYSVGPGISSWSVKLITINDIAPRWRISLLYQLLLYLLLLLSVTIVPSHSVGKVDVN